MKAQINDTETKEKLILIGAQPRSGNHLIRGLLDGHTNLLVPPCEDYFIRNYLRMNWTQYVFKIIPNILAPFFYKLLQKNGNFERVNAGENINTYNRTEAIDLVSYYSYIAENHSRIKNPICCHLAALQGALRIDKSINCVKVYFCALRPEFADLSNLTESLSELYDLKVIVLTRSLDDIKASVRGRSDYQTESNIHRRNELFLKELEKVKGEIPDRLLDIDFSFIIEHRSETAEMVCQFLEIQFEEILKEHTLYSQKTAINTSY